jgi:hypothetical protein
LLKSGDLDFDVEEKRESSLMGRKVPMIGKEWGLPRQEAQARGKSFSLHPKRMLLPPRDMLPPWQGNNAIMLRRYLRYFTMERRRKALVCIQDAKTVNVLCGDLRIGL